MVELGLLRTPEPNNIISQINPKVDILYTYYTYGFVQCKWGVKGNKEYCVQLWRS
jgi:hypothetical protein